MIQKFPSLGLGLGMRGAVTKCAREAEVVSWVARVVAAGSSVAEATQLAADQWFSQIRLAGIRAKILRANLFCGANLTAALVPIIVDKGNAADTNVNFVAGDYTLATGLQGNGTSKYLRTGLIPSTDGITTTSGHLACYINSNPENTGANLQCQNSGTQMWGLYVDYSGTTYYDHNNPTEGQGRISAGSQAGLTGFWCGSRRAAADITLFRNSASIASGTGNGGSVPSYEVAVFACNAAGTFNTWSNDRMAFYSIGLALTDTEIGALYTATQAFQAALGRSV